MYYELVIDVIPGRVGLDINCTYSKTFLHEIKQQYFDCSVKNCHPSGKRYKLEYRDVERCVSCDSFKKQNISKLVDICYNLNRNKFCFNCPENFFLFDSLLRTVSSVILVLNRGFLLHSAGIVKEKNCCELYSGPTNSGKSTLAKKFSSKKVISDELCPVWISNNKVYSCKSIFYSEVRPEVVSHKIFNVKKIFFFKKNRTEFNKKQPQVLPRKYAVELLLKNIFFVLKDTEFTNRIFDTVLTIVRLTECYEI